MGSSKQVCYGRLPGPVGMQGEGHKNAHINKKRLQFLIQCFADKMPGTQVQRKLEFPVKKRITRQTRKAASKENNENSPVRVKPQFKSPRKRQGEGKK